MHKPSPRVSCVLSRGVPWVWERAAACGLRVESVESDINNVDFIKPPCKWKYVYWVDRLEWHWSHLCFLFATLLLFMAVEVQAYDGISLITELESSGHGDEEEPSASVTKNANNIVATPVSIAIHLVSFVCNLEFECEQGKMWLLFNWLFVNTFRKLLTTCSMKCTNQVHAGLSLSDSRVDPRTAYSISKNTGRFQFQKLGIGHEKISSWNLERFWNRSPLSIRALVKCSIFFFTGTQVSRELVQLSAKQVKFTNHQCFSPPHMLEFSTKTKTRHKMTTKSSRALHHNQ